MARKSKEELEVIKKECNVSELYSWSRFNTWKRDTYEYFLKYVVKAKEDKTNSFYSIGGGLLHDTIEDYYLGKVDKNDMARIYEEEANKLLTLGFRFDRTNKEKNDKIAVKYLSCNQHFFDNFIPVNEILETKRMTLEEFIIIRIGNFVFQGYIDATQEYVSDEGIDKLKIIDWKSSTIYKGEKVIKERGQLLLYALGKIQQGWSIEDITIGWMFTKYVYIDVPNKDSFKTRIIERNEIGSKLLASVKGQLKKCRLYDEAQTEEYIDILTSTKSLKGMPEVVFNFVDEIETTATGDLKKAFINKVRKAILGAEKYPEEIRDEICSEMIIENSIDVLPEEVKALYSIRDCFVEIPFTMDDLNDLKQDIKNFIVKSEKLKFMYSKNEDDSLFYQEIEGNDTYFLANLCGYSSKLHKPYADYLEKRRLERGEIEEDTEEDDIDETEEMLALYKELGISLDLDRD